MRRLRGLRARITRFALVPASPENLAVLRIITFTNVLLWFPRAAAIEGFADVPRQFRAPPMGLGTVAPGLPITRPLIRWGSRAVTLSAGLGLVGLWTTPAAIAVVGFGLYVGAIQWYFTRVGHQHHMLWFAALIAASPSGDALSVDALRRRRRGGPRRYPPSAAYGLPMRLGWILLGSIYLLPGVAKLATGGSRWVFSDNLRNRTWLEWHGRARDPSPWLVRFVDSPVLMRSGALVTVVFEVGFVFMIPTRRGRVASTILSWAFHGGVWLLLELDFFMSLALLHLGLHRWPGGRSARTVAPADAPVRMPSAAPAVVVGAIVAANHVMPLTGQHYGWPFTTYPIFHGLAPRTETVLRAERLRAGESPRALDVRATFRRCGLSPGISWFLERAVLTALAAGDEQRFDELWRLLRRDGGLRHGDEVVFHADDIDVDPRRRGEPAVQTRELGRRTA